LGFDGDLDIFHFRPLKERAFPVFFIRVYGRGLAVDTTTGYQCNGTQKQADDYKLY
jgi:hypothetical protein